MNFSQEIKIKNRLVARVILSAKIAMPSNEHLGIWYFDTDQNLILLIINHL